MEFRETLIAAQRNQQQKASANTYYKARFDPPKKEQKQKDKLSANIQKFLAKKEEEERQKKLEAQKKREELQSMRDSKALKKIQKSLKVFKSANKSVLADAIDHDNTAVTLEGPDQPDQDDYGYESQEAAALYQKMMQKYSKTPDEPKFSLGKSTVKKDLNGTRERVKQALQHEDEPVPHKRRRKRENSPSGREASPPAKYEADKKKDDHKSDKPKIRKPMPPPLDFNQLLKLAEEKKSIPIEIGPKKIVTDTEPERPMTKKQKREYEEEMARRQRRQERLDAEKAGGRKGNREEGRDQTEKQTERKVPNAIGRIPKLGEKSSNTGATMPNNTRDKIVNDKDKAERLVKEKERARQDREKADKERIDRERLEKLKAERERIDRELEKLSKDKERLDKTKHKLESNRPSDKALDKAKLPSKESDRLESKKSIDLKSQNTYRIDKNSNEKKNNTDKQMNGHNNSANFKSVVKSKEQFIKEKMLLAKQKILLEARSLKANGQTKIEPGKKMGDRGVVPKKPEDMKASKSSISQTGSSKPKISNSFDFDKHVSSMKNNGARQAPAGKKSRSHTDEKRLKQKRRVLDSESEYDSEMDDFIDDEDEDTEYSSHIKEIFGYDRSRYRDLDDDDDPTMESNFAQQQREEYISKKIGIMEDLEDMRMEAMQKKKQGKKSRRISDD